MRCKSGELRVGQHTHENRGFPSGQVYIKSTECKIKQDKEARERQ